MAAAGICASRSPLYDAAQSPTADIKGLSAPCPLVAEVGFSADCGIAVKANHPRRSLG